MEAWHGCVVECHPDRSGRFLDRASLSAPPSQESPGGDGVPRVECRPCTFTATSNWASQPDGLQDQGEIRAKGAGQTARSGPSQNQPWDVILALSLCPGLRVLQRAQPAGPQPVEGQELRSYRTT